MRQADFFRPLRAASKPNRRTMFVIDAGYALDGTAICRLKCDACGDETDWVKQRSVTAELKGRVCPVCKGDPS